MQAGSVASQELADRGVGAERCEQLDMAVPDVEQGRVDTLIGHRLAMHERHSERVAVERERRVDVRDGDADVIDRGQHCATRIPVRQRDGRARAGSIAVAAASPSRPWPDPGRARAGDPAHDPLDVIALDDLLDQQGGGDLVELGAMAVQDGHGAIAAPGRQAREPPCRAGGGSGQRPRGR